MGKRYSELRGEVSSRFTLNCWVFSLISSAEGVSKNVASWRWNERGSGQRCWSILACENRFREKRGYYCLRGKLSINLIDVQIPLGPANRRSGYNKPQNQLPSIKLCKPYGILRQNSSCLWHSGEKYCTVTHSHIYSTYECSSNVFMKNIFVKVSVTLT